MWNQIKTVLLLGTLSGVVLAIGTILGGQTGLVFALVFAVLMNFGSYFFSHKLVLKMYKAKPMDKKQHPKVHSMIEQLAKKMNLPKPALYIVPMPAPNAFATGPTPKKAVVACTQGILDLLDDSELEGVLAHEMSHIKNRDMLITTIAATMAAVISYIAMVAKWGAIFGGFRGDNNESGGLIGVLAMAILAPIIALILQLAISRSREYLADSTGANYLKNGDGLASALEKMQNVATKHPLQGNSTTSSLFIVNPFRAAGLQAMFSTHPPTKERVKRLRNFKN